MSLPGATTTKALLSSHFLATKGHELMSPKLFCDVCDRPVQNPLVGGSGTKRCFVTLAARLVAQVYADDSTSTDVHCCDACFLQLLQAAAHELRHAEKLPKRRIEPQLAVLAGGKHYLSRHKGVVIAECERCGDKRLFETKIKPEWLERICLKCHNESDVESPLTFRMPTKIEVATMTPDEELSRWVVDRHE
jgi:hypothetical protein